MEKQIRIKRLYFRSAHRGSKEIDLILGPYAAENLETMSDDELDEFEAFLSENDTDIWDWVTGKAEPEEAWRYKNLLARLRKIYDVTG
ncbi:MAG TPA: succinate dehydrogenase assembly factor 2 [Rickettsiales bacterium]|nr:succinate dehydrogenase assembly factor 2 [Rickettsiales bacterium]